MLSQSHLNHAGLFLKHPAPLFVLFSFVIVMGRLKNVGFHILLSLVYIYTYIAGVTSQPAFVACHITVIATSHSVHY